MLHKEEVQAHATWNLSDTNLLIPVVENSDSLSGNVIVEALGESSEIDSTAVAPTLLIGLNKTFFDQSTCSKDVIFIQNSDIKYPQDMQLDIPGDKAFLSSGNYLISFVDSAKITNWDNITLKSSQKPQKDGFDSSTSSVLFSSGNRCSEKLTSLNETSNKIFESQFIGEISSPTENANDELSCSQSDINDFEKTLPTSFVQKKAAASCEFSSHFDRKEFSMVEKVLIPERSLPLKKKAKMKGSEELSPSSRIKGNGCKKSCTGVEDTDSSSNLEALRELARKKRGRTIGKRRCCYSDSELSDNNEIPSWDSKPNTADLNNVQDLIECLKANSIIDNAFGELILSGTSEMRRDIVQELQSSSYYLSETTFSNELLAFALLLHFKNRNAFHFMKHLWGCGWPSEDHLSSWKRLINNYGRADEPQYRSSILHCLPEVPLT